MFFIVLCQISFPEGSLIVIIDSGMVVCMRKIPFVGLFNNVKLSLLISLTESNWLKFIGVPHETPFFE